MVIVVMIVMRMVIMLMVVMRMVIVSPVACDSFRRRWWLYLFLSQSIPLISALLSSVLTQSPLRISSLAHRFHYGIRVFFNLERLQNSAKCNGSNGRCVVQSWIIGIRNIIYAYSHSFILTGLASTPLLLFDKRIRIKLYRHAILGDIASVLM